MLPRTSSGKNFTNIQNSFEETKEPKTPNTGITDLGFTKGAVSLGDNPIINTSEYKQMSRDIPPANKKATREKLENIMNNTAIFDTNEHEEIMRIITELLSLLVRFKYQRTFSTDNNILNNIIYEINKTILEYNRKIQSTVSNDKDTILTSREIFELAKNTSSNWNIFGKRNIPTNLTIILQKIGTTTYGNRKPSELFLSRELCNWLNYEIGNPTIKDGSFSNSVEVIKKSYHNEKQVKRLCDFVYGTQINEKDSEDSMMIISKLQEFMEQQLDGGTEESRYKKIYTIQRVIKIVKQYPNIKNLGLNYRDFKHRNYSDYHKIDLDFLKTLESHATALKIICQEQSDPALEGKITEFNKALALYRLRHNKLLKIREAFHEHLAKKMESGKHKKEYEAHGTILTEHGKKKKSQFISYQNEHGKWHHDKMLQEGDKGVDIIHNGPSGTEKRLTLKSKKKVVLENTKEPMKKLFNGAKIRNIFTKLGISKHFVAALKNGRKYLARNAGTNLYEHNKNKKIAINVTDFFPILWGLEILKNEGYYLFDLKPDNIGIEKDKDGKITLTVFDTDELCELEHPIWRITPNYSCVTLMDHFKAIDIENKLKRQKPNITEIESEKIKQDEGKQKIIGSILMERAMAVTMLETFTEYDSHLDTHDENTKQIEVAQTNIPFIKQFW